MERKTCKIKIGGEYACFSRPEMKVERVSYPVITPSAARGAIEAILWKPEIRWEVQRIDVLREIRETALLRNEIGSRQSPRQGGLIIEQHRQQRTTRALRDVAYIIHADLCLQPHATEPLAKYLDQFERRVLKGQCFQTPYLGTREFPAWFELATEEDRPLETIDFEIGPMLYDIAFVPAANSRSVRFRLHDGRGAHEVQATPRALFFDAVIHKGILRVPPEIHERKRELEAR